MKQALGNPEIKQKKTGLLTLLLLTMLPLLYAVRGSFVIWSRYLAPNHEYWADPDHTYLYNGLLFATGNEITHVGHPGTPVQLLNGLLIWGLWKVRIIQSETATLEAHTLEAAESYLLFISFTLLITQCICLYLLGLFVAKAGGNKLALVAQLPTITISLALSKDLLSNKPEGFIFIFTLIALIVIVIADQSNKKPEVLQRLSLLLGILLGLIVAMKISSLPLALLLPLLLWDRRLTLRTYGFTILFTIVFLSPVMFQYRTIFAFWFSYQSRAGSGVLETFLLRDARTFIEAPLVYVALLLAVLVVINNLVRHKSFSTITSRSKVVSNRAILGKNAFRYSVVFIPILLLQIILANSRGPWWVIPALPVAGVALAAALTPWVQQIHDTPRQGFVTRLVVAITLISALFFTFYSARLLVVQSEERNSREPLLLESILQAQRGNTLIYDWSIGWRKTALGNECGALVFGVGPEFSETIQDRCPNVWLANVAYDQILPFGSNWDGCQDLKGRLADKRPVYFFNPVGQKPHPTLEVETVGESGDWQILKIVGISCPESSVK